MSRASTPVIDPVALTQRLIRRPSVTPADEGAMDILEEVLTGLGFTCRRMPFGPSGSEAVGSVGRIENLYARRGTASPNLCFAGHTDVVPTGAAEGWSAGPFDAEIRDGVLYGRGACDMKGAIAAFVAATARHLDGKPPRGSISFLITGDEEGPAVDGTVKVLEWMRAHDQIPDFCLVGEPTNPARLGSRRRIIVSMRCCAGI